MMWNLYSLYTEKGIYALHMILTHEAHGYHWFFSSYFSGIMEARKKCKHGVWKGGQGAREESLPDMNVVKWNNG